MILLLKQTFEVQFQKKTRHQSRNHIRMLVVYMKNINTPLCLNLAKGEISEHPY